MTLHLLARARRQRRVPPVQGLQLQRHLLKKSACKTSSKGSKGKRRKRFARKRKKRSASGRKRRTESVPKKRPRRRPRKIRLLTLKRPASTFRRRNKSGLKKPRNAERNSLLLASLNLMKRVKRRTLNLNRLL
jgi:hypothetical protein